MFRTSGMLKQPNEQKRVFLSKLESESTRKGATCEAELTSTRFSKKCLEYTVRVNVTWKRKKSCMYSLLLSNIENLTSNYKVYDTRTSTCYTNNMKNHKTCSVNAGCHAYILHVLCSAYLILVTFSISHIPTAIHSESYKSF